MRKKIVVFLLSVCAVLSTAKISVFSLSASSAAVMIAETGELVFESSSRERRSMASTTKIMTALLAVESGRLGETVRVTREMTAVEGTSMGLRQGDELTLENIVKGMMLLSGNDAANAAAVFLCGSAEKFAEKMNLRASEIGMKDTHFVTPSGLDAKEHYSTAYDMALLASCAIKNPVFRDIVSQYTGQVEYIKPAGKYTYRNHNRFLKLYDGACGIKTGFTKKSGRCLVTAVERDGFTLVAVTLNAPDDWNDHRYLYDTCLGNVKIRTVNDRFYTAVSVAGGEESTVTASVKESISCPTCKNGDIRTALFVKPFIYAPALPGEIVGFVRLYVNGNVYDEYPLTLDSGVKAKKAEPSVFERIADYLRNKFGRIKNG